MPTGDQAAAVVHAETSDDAAPAAAALRVAIAHEWLVRYAGSERCVDEMLRLFPAATLVTTLFAPEAVPRSFGRARTGLLQHIPGATNKHEWLVPLMPLDWRLRRPLSGYDLVISSSHACAKAVRVAPGTPHLCYCHTPMRYAWSFETEAERFARRARLAARGGMALFRAWDRATARRVTRFVANSSAVADRIRRYYGVSADIVHPPVRTDFFTPGEERGEDFLYVGRLVGYKRPDLVVDAFSELPHRLLVVGRGQLEQRLRARATPNVEFLGDVPDDELRRLYRTARALVTPGEEDFGIITAEAQACGTPVIGFARGGSTDIVVHGRTGWLLEGQTVDELRRLVGTAARERLDEAEIRTRAERFAPERFRNGLAGIALELVGERPRVEAAA